LIEETALGHQDNPVVDVVDPHLIGQYRPLEIYTFLVLEYFVLIICISSGMRWLENRLRSVEI